MTQARANVLKNSLASFLVLVFISLSIFAFVEGARIFFDVAQLQVQHDIVIFSPEP